MDIALSVCEFRVTGVCSIGKLFDLNYAADVLLLNDYALLSEAFPDRLNMCGHVWLFERLLFTK